MRRGLRNRKALLAGVVALVAVGVTGSAQFPLDDKALPFTAGGAPGISGTGLCWHTAYGPAPLWADGCQPAVSRIAPAPERVAPAALPGRAPGHFFFKPGAN